MTAKSPSSTTTSSTKFAFIQWRRNPSIAQLSRWQMVAKLTRSFERMISPRRMLLSLVAVVLTLAWLGQAIAGVLFRGETPIERLMVWIPVSLAGYALWNVFKTVGKSNQEPFDWTPAEQEWLFASPLRRTEIVQYRLTAILRAAFTKSFIFVLVMTPDLSHLVLGFLGIMMALVFIDLMRIMLELVVYGMTPKQLLCLRGLVYGGGAVIVLRAVVCALLANDAVNQMQTAASFGFVFGVGRELMAQTSTWYGVMLLAPFEWLCDIVLAGQVTGGIVIQLLFAATVNGTLLWSLTPLDSWVQRKRLKRERAGLSNAKRNSTLEQNQSAEVEISAPNYCSGIGPLAWRQAIGAFRYHHSLALSLLIPMVLSCLPAFSGVTGFSLVANTVGALAFYSLLLLPASLKFDFRRDIDRLTILKALPVTPMRTTIGQLTIPVLLTTVFQFLTLLVAFAVSPFPLHFLLGAMAVLLPFNVFIFSFENLVFLWYPHRIHQEGIQVLLRSILAFTAKSLLFLVGLGLTFAGVVLSRWVVEGLPASGAILTTGQLFGAGMFAVLALAAYGTLNLTARAFSRFDPSCDLVGLD